MSRYYWRRLNNTQGLTVPDGKQWKVLGGKIVHVTGTISALSYRDPKPLALQLTRFATIPAATANGSYALNPITASSLYTEEETCRTFDLIIPTGYQIYFQGDAAAYARVLVEETDVKK